MNQISFVVDAKKYFEVDAETLVQVNEGDLVLVSLDFENKKAEYVWYPGNEEPSNYPTQQDDFDAVVNIFEKEIAEEMGK